MKADYVQGVMIRNHVYLLSVKDLYNAWVVRVNDSAFITMCD